MDEMLAGFDHEAKFYLTRINRSFKLLGRPFNEEFRKLFLQMSTDRYSAACSLFHNHIQSFFMDMFSHRSPQTIIELHKNSNGSILQRHS